MAFFVINVPQDYGYVILTCVVAPTVTSILLGGEVMKARKSMDVPYPNLYATPGYHKRADEFNRVQRGHQHMFEQLTGFTAMSLLGGLKHPIACSISGLCFSVGSFLYQRGYADTDLDVKMARFKKGGGIKFLAYIGALLSCASIAGTVIGWW